MPTLGIAQSSGVLKKGFVVKPTQTRVARNPGCFWSDVEKKEICVLSKPRPVDLSRPIPTGGGGCGGSGKCGGNQHGIEPYVLEQTSRDILAIDPGTVARAGIIKAVRLDQKLKLGRSER